MCLEWSPDFSEIVKALPAAQAAIGKVVKDSESQHMGKRYASLAAVIEAVIPAMNTNGIAVMQPVEFDGQNVTVQTMLIHTSGQFMRTRLSMRPVKTDPQGIGSAITYARRYALLAIAGVAPEDDDGAEASQVPKTAGEKTGDGQQPRHGSARDPQQGGGGKDWREFARAHVAKYKAAKSHSELAAIDRNAAEDLVACENEAPDVNNWLVEQFKRRTSGITEEQNRSEAA